MRLTYSTLYKILDGYVRFQAIKQAGLDQSTEYQDQLEKMVKTITRELVDKKWLTLREQQHLSVEEGIEVILEYELMGNTNET